MHPSTNITRHASPHSAQRALACLVSTYTRYLRTFRTIFFRWSFFVSSNHRVLHFHSRDQQINKQAKKNHGPEMGRISYSNIARNNNSKLSHVKPPSRTTTLESVQRWYHQIIAALRRCDIFKLQKIRLRIFTTKLGGVVLAF